MGHHGHKGDEAGQRFPLPVDSDGLCAAMRSLRTDHLVTLFLEVLKRLFRHTVFRDNRALLKKTRVQ
jgi:hypothetical protein